MFLLLLAACNPFTDDNEWIYAQTPVPPPDERSGKPLVITVGDSIAAGWQDCRDRICTGIEYDWWQDAIGDRAIVLSRGIGNSTTTDLLDRWEQDSQDADIVFILTGVNDVARDVDANTIIRHFEALHQRAVEAGIIPIFSTIMPSDTTTTENQHTVQTVNADLLSRQDWLVIDLHSAMQDPTNPGYLRREEIVRDGSAHPNRDGYEHMARVVREWWLAHEIELTTRP